LRGFLLGTTIDRTGGGANTPACLSKVFYFFSSVGIRPPRLIEPKPVLLS
jgi:hypothetical protein